MSKVFSFDAETDGLYGKVWAIGAVVFESSIEVARFEGQISPDELENEWVRESIVPYVNLPMFENALLLREAFWNFWMTHKQGAVCIADFGSPVESGLFRKCVEDELQTRQWDGPYPLHEVATMLFAANVDPDIDRLAFTEMQGMVKHNPVHDAVVSAATWIKATEIVQKR